jgi:hypothetical protein
VFNDNLCDAAHSNNGFKSCLHFSNRSGSPAYFYYDEEDDDDDEEEDDDVNDVMY